eukprot:symbB.v1.2.005651.t1/scaffold327.1/size259883/4
MLSWGPVAGKRLGVACNWGIASRSSTSLAGQSLALHVPQWYGAGNLEPEAQEAVVQGAAWGFAALQRTLPMPSHLVEIEPTSASSGKVKHHQALSKVATQVSQHLQLAQPEQVFTVGGDCSVDLAPMMGDAFRAFSRYEPPCHAGYCA